MQSAQLPDQLVAGPEVEMIGIAEDDPGIQLVGQIALGESLDGALCSDRHEYGRFDIAMRCMQHPRAGAGNWAFGVDIEGDPGHWLILCKHASLGLSGAVL